MRARIADGTALTEPNGREPDFTRRPTVRLALASISLIGFGVLFKALLDHGIFGFGGEGGGDIFAYWIAGQNVVSGAPVYGAGVGGYAAFLYPPIMAQAMAPLSLLPFPVAVWLWRAVELVCLRIAVGSWRASGIALLVWPPLLAEIDAGNVHLPIAAAVAMTIRGDARWPILAGLTKFASLAAVPLAWRVDRHGLFIGAGAAVLVVGASVALSPGLWWSFLDFLPKVPRLDGSDYNVGAGVPLLLRLAIAGLCAVLAMRWHALAALAATLALPILWFHGLSVLVAVVAAVRPSSVKRLFETWVPLGILGRP